ncbi:hypothetical protein C1645_870686 [Glomus cerebriforme]|uniref:Uncharacterized protein n=1 Tax=Glomus cerebriforme TaxID=658196 RepID=A0A397TM35_9GLOM|nr:hypothetical protein C1645_870686 [Glomus cerebriforme]
MEKIPNYTSKEKFSPPNPLQTVRPQEPIVKKKLFSSLQNFLLLPFSDFEEIKLVQDWLDTNDPTKVIYLKVKAFIPSDRSIETQIEDFDIENVIFLKGKFIAYSGWYSVNATSIKVLEGLDFYVMLSIGLNIMIVGITTKTVRNINGKSVLKFYVEENFGDRKLHKFWVEITHNSNLRYLANKMNSINQTIRSTTMIIMDISLVSTNHNSGHGQQALNVPWLNTQFTDAQMELTPNQGLSSALKANPIPNMNSSTMTTITNDNNTPQVENDNVI